MGALRNLTAIERRLLLALFACAMLVRGLIPDGWMPVQAASGGIAVEICSGLGHETIVLPGHDAQHDKAPAHDSSGDHPCAFAGAGLAGAPAQFALLVPPLAGHFTPPLPFAALAAVGRGLAAPPPPPTGPPAFA